ncbi:type II toxin-antitoxin system SpoIISA family toxin [Niallia sp. JL1B1071]|uniref:type II toxin-antitoxin system SpoIISA family toxin n=1 Tax=Niallia tiangongensis TaxID=3237105 RepID=UPI0037DC4902
MTTIYFSFLSAIILLVVLSLGYFWWRTDKYVENLQAIRKSYYVLFFLVICLGVFSNQLQIVDWKTSLSFVV